MRISDWSSDVCSSDLSEHEKHIGLFRSDRVGSAHRDFHARRIEIVLQRVTVDQEIKLAGTDAEIVEQGVALGRRAIAGDLQALRLHLLQHLRSEEHTSELQSLMRISYAVFCLKKKTSIHYPH